MEKENLTNFMQNKKFINYVHILFIGPFLIYIGLKKPSNNNFYIILLLLALIIIASFYNKYKNNELIVWLYVHLLLFVSLLLCICYLKFYNKDIPYYLYSFLVAVGCGAFGYHLIKLIK
jgi:CDP-diglyceride synthetase